MHRSGNRTSICSLFLVNSTSAARLDEYCVCLRRNIKHAMVLSLNLVSALNNASAHLQAFCPLDVQSRERLIMHEVMTDPTYSSLFQIASASLAPETSSTLAVIAHADLVLTPGWDQLSDKCLEDMHSTRHAFQISRMEPRRCFPDSNLRPRSHVDKNAVYEKGPKFFQSMCDSFLWAAISQDAIAFNRRIDGQPWTDPLLEHLDFHPNRLNAEMRMGCALKKFGFALSNPCHDLGLMHNHCSSVRNYKGTTKVAGNTSLVNTETPRAGVDDETALIAKCRHSIPRTRLPTACKSIGQRALMLAAIRPPTSSSISHTQAGMLAQASPPHPMSPLPQCCERLHAHNRNGSKSHIARSTRSTTCPSHRFAVMVVGELDAAGWRAFVADTGWRSQERHILQPLLNRSVTVDTFLCTDAGAAQLPAAILEKLQVRGTKALTVATSLTHRQALCYEAALEWLQFESTQPDCAFTHFLWTRFDHLWYADLSPPSDLPSTAIALRARLVAANVTVSVDMLSWPVCGFVTGTGTHLCPSLAAALKTAHTDGTNALSKQCVTMDDQVGIVPASLAPTFFASYAFGLGPVNSPSTAGATKKLVVRVPEMPCPENASHMEVAEHAWDVCPGSCWPWQTNSGEGKMTRRLADGSFPVYLTPFRVRLPRVNRHSKGTYSLPLGEAPWVRCPSAQAYRATGNAG